MKRLRLSFLQWIRRNANNRSRNDCHLQYWEKEEKCSSVRLNDAVVSSGPTGPVYTCEGEGAR